MTVTILTGHEGRIRKGERRSPATEFKPGQHWRKPQPFREADWLLAEYIEKGRSTGDIAQQFGVSDSAVLFWLNHHKIPRRNISQARDLKHWGLTGPANPMFGKFGPECPNYVDGSTPERQRMYSRGIGRDFLRSVYERDGYCCVRCGSPNTGRRSLHAHHIRPWAGNPDLRFDLTNAITLCRACHGWVHSKRNTEKEFIA